LRHIINLERLPQNGPVIIVSNHLSYYDWAILSSIYWRKYIVFISNQDLQNRFFVSFLIKLNKLILINTIKPGFGYFKEALRQLRQNEIVVIYPEGTRSKTGLMQLPKTGFVKLALHTGAPIVPIAMRGTYTILPPHRVVPAFKRCDVVVGEPIKISANNKLFKHIFSGEKNVRKISSEAEEKIAVIIMDLVATMAQQQWESEVVGKYPELLRKQEL
jgi:1-acyl-sn-glycerol-3-phosphate acyltransferase